MGGQERPLGLGLLLLGACSVLPTEPGPWDVIEEGVLGHPGDLQ